MSHASLLDHFSALDDPRQRGKVLYPLPEIMLLILCATLSGAEDFVETQTWGSTKLPFLRGILPFRHGIPSHDTLNDVMNALDGDLFAAAFTAWVDGLREAEPDIVAIDGKTSRRAHGRAHAGGHPLHMVSAWATRQRLVLGQEATDAKSNEISAIPLLLERLHLTGALVTIDVEPVSATGSSEPARGHPNQDCKVYSGTRGRLSSGAESQAEKPCHRGCAVLRCARTARPGAHHHRRRPRKDRDPQPLGQYIG